MPDTPSESPQSVTLRSVVAAYCERKLAEEMHDDWSFLIYRPFSWLLVPLLAHLRVRPTAVTLLGLGLALALPLLAWRTGPAAWWAVGAGAFLFSVCDAVDGDLARCTRGGSVFGAWLDGQVDLVYRVGAYAAVGIMAGALPGSVLAGFNTVALALFSATLVLLARLARQAVSPPPAAGWPGWSAWRMTVPGFISGLDHLLPLLVLAFGAAGRLDWLLCWLVGYSLLDYADAQWQALRARW